MFRLIGYGLRMIRWMIVIGLLLLIVQLLLVEPAERQPVVWGWKQQMIQSASAVRDWLAEYWLAGRNVDSLPANPPADVRSAREPWTGLHRPPRADWQAESGLPADFLSELEQAVVRSPDPEARARWSELAAVADPETQIESAVQLARWLPGQWWAVDSRLVHELDLPNVLGKKRYD